MCNSCCSLGIERPHREPQLAAAVLAAVARSLRRRVLQQHGLHRHLFRLAIMPNAKMSLATGRQLGDDGGQIVGMVDGMTVDAGNDVAGLEPRALSRTLRLHRADQGTVRRC